MKREATEDGSGQQQLSAGDCHGVSDDPGVLSAGLTMSVSRRNFLRGMGGFSALAALAPSLLARRVGIVAAAALAESEVIASPSPSSTFVHPGLLHTQADFDRMRTKLLAKDHPWDNTWQPLLGKALASKSWRPNPQVVVYRGSSNDNWWYLAWDIHAAYLNALHWRISGDTQAAECAVRILNAWSSALQKIWWADGKYDGFLVAGIQGYQFANVGEIMRSYSGWKSADFVRFQAMMRLIFYPMNAGITDLSNPSSLNVYSSWDLCAMAAVMAIGVLCDNHAMFDAAVTYFKEGLGNGAIAQMVYYMHPGYLGQTQEAGRDQGHDTLSISLVGTVCEMAWNQGVDLYGYANNRVLAACEYVAKGNLPQSSSYYTVPFISYANPSVTDTAFSSDARGIHRPTWALIYNHYVNRCGIAAPYSQKFAALMEPESGGNYPDTNGWDQFGYGSLTFARDPIAKGAPPSGLTAVTSAGHVVLSWWGSAYGKSYTVKRSTVSGGPYAVVARGITDLLTYTDAPPASGTYYYVVTALTATGESANSNEAPGIADVLLDTCLAFDEGAGGKANDSSGRGHVGTLLGGAAWAPGRGGKRAVALNGRGAYVSLPAGLFESIGDFTLALWVYWGGGQTWARIFDFGTGPDKSMFLSPCNVTNQLHFSASLNQGYGQCTIEAPFALAAGRWVHIAVTLSGQLAKLYANGSVVGKSGAMLYPPFQMGRTTNNWLGRSQHSNDPFFNGLIDEFRLYRGALSDQQVASLAAS